MTTGKTIDGLPVRPATTSRVARMKSPRHAISSVSASPKHAISSVPVKKAPKRHIIPITTGEPNDPLKQKAMRENSLESAASAAAAEIASEREAQAQTTEAHDDFLKPVETFDFDITSDDLKSDMKNSRKHKKDTKSAARRPGSQSATPATASQKIKKKPGKVRRIITTILLIIVILIIGVVVWALVWGNDIIAKLTGGNSNIFSAIGALTSETFVDLKTDTNGRTNILVFGTEGYDMDGTVGRGTHDGSQLTDSIMAIGLDQNSGDIVMTSIPRDLKVPTACYAGKINEVFVCHNENGKNDAAGAESLMSTIGEVLGINFQYYAHINWQSLVQIVNSIGGITVTLDEDIYDPNYTKVNIKAGVPTTLDGEGALALARARHGTAGGDFSRGTSQQKILIGIKDRISAKFDEGSFDLGTAISLVQALGDNLRTNISIEEIKTAVHLIDDLDLNQMRQVMLYDYNNYSKSLMKNATINGLSYVIPTAGAGNYTNIHKVIAREFSTNAVEREGARIAILNGTETSGLAATEGKTLEADGYNITVLDNAPAGEYTNEHTVYLINENTSATANALADHYNIGITEASELPAGIDTNDIDIVIILGGSGS